MKRSTLIFGAGIFVAGLIVFAGCKKADLLSNGLSPTSVQMAKGGPGGGGTTEPAGNNLSFPVIWAENTSITLRIEPAGGPKLDGEWWYVWGDNPIDPSSPIYSCNPALSDPCYPEGTTGVYKAYLQKDANNIWQAYNSAPSSTVIVDQIDWGDNLESSSFSLTSKVRVEVGLYENFATPVKEYLMRHVSGWGTDEVHGLATDLAGNIQSGPGTQGTVYTPLARLTIQKISGTDLTWDATNHMWTGDATTPLYNHAIYEAGTGPAYFGAEVNVKGKIIYGYGWDIRKLNTGVGTYRLTFSFDKTTGGVDGNTDFDATTSILTAAEEGEIVVAAEPVGGVAVLDHEKNLTYIDIIVTGKANGGGGGKPIK